MTTNKSKDISNETDPPDIGRNFKEVIRGTLDFDEYDFSASWVDLISSIAGYYDIESGEANDYGMMRVKSIIQSWTDFKPSDETEIIYQCTSFGKLYPKLLIDFINNILGKKIDVTNQLLK